MINVFGKFALDPTARVERIYDESDKDTWSEGLGSIHYRYIRCDEIIDEVKIGTSYDFYDMAEKISWYGVATEKIDNEIQILIF